MSNRITELLKLDITLRSIIKDLELNNPKEVRDPFTSVLHAIVSQQLSTRVAQTLISRFKLTFGHNPQPSSLLTFSESDFKSIGLSRQKSSYIQNVARHCLDNSEFWNFIDDFSDVQIIEELTKIKGLGEWTVQMLLIFTLHREDVFPVGDLAIRDAMSQLYKVEGSKKEVTVQLKEISQQWRPYRSYACRYLWRWRDEQKKK